MSYGHDVFGRKVLVGLTYAETQEFELLDAAPLVDEYGRMLEWGNEDSLPPNHARWLELYKSIKPPDPGLILTGSNSVMSAFHLKAAE